jgi:beta-alanine--pyruvate transaminase
MVQHSVPSTSQLMVDFTQMKSFGRDPLIIDRGMGIHLWDVFGKEYIDGLSGVFTANLGHGVDALVDAGAEQGRKVSFSPPTMGTNPAALALADLLVRITPDQFSTVKFYSGGSEATENAIKIARQYHLQRGNARKTKIIGRYLAYHGGTGHSMAAGGHAEWKWRYEPLAGGFIHVTPPARPGCSACRRLDGCTLACIDAIEEAIVREGPQTVAAVIAEPVMMSAGVHVPPPGYFSRLRELCDEHDVLLIHDEIITGFGRTGTLFASEWIGGWPDILCCGKGITAGYAALSATILADKVTEPFWGEHDENIQYWGGHTYGGNPVACAVGKAAVEMLVERDIVGHAARVGAYLNAGLADLAERLTGASHVRGIGMLYAFVLSEPVGRAVHLAARQRGLLIRPGHDFVVLAPPLVTTEAEADQIVARLGEAVVAVTG